jgi:hypothetical protein
MVKYSVYAAKPQSLENLKQQVTEFTASMPEEMCHHAVYSTFNCMLVYTENEGQ